MSRVYKALGLMSGTSLDGVDVALLETDGETLHGFGHSVTVPYAAGDRALLQEATEAALMWDFNGPPPNLLSRAEDALDRAHIEAALSFGTVDVIGYHGQTVLHRPDRARTLQLGQGQRLADQLGAPCVYDFRSEDVEAGGQGAPLAPVYHRALVEAAGLPGVTAVLNLGGVGNVTLVSERRIGATDTGPANGPLDNWLGSVDYGGSISASGTPDLAKVERWLDRDFFRRPWPKSADRYDFDVLDDLADMTKADGAATLCAFTAMSVRRTVDRMVAVPDRMIVCGGGRHNRTIMAMLRLEFGCPVVAAEHYGWDSDAIEAQAFAFLAVRVIRGLPNSFPTTTGVPTPTVGGRIAQPSRR